jgi:hypothetical protein
MKSIFLLLLALNSFSVVYAQCYQPLYNHGMENYIAGNYSDAISNWQDAKQCPDLPAGSKLDIAEWIGKARKAIQAIQEQRTAFAQDCFEPLLKKGMKEFNAGNCAVAKKKWKGALECPNLTDTQRQVLNNWIAKCNKKR